MKEKRFGVFDRISTPMNQDRWKAVNQIFHDALEVAPEQRHALVVALSKGDSDIEAEVELLLRADVEAESYLDKPVDLLQTFFPEIYPIAIGDMLCGRFRIVREVAEGGMGRVFEAFDTELGVRVALKVMLPEITSSPEALARFRQEVRLARSITHPNICRTFDLEREVREVDGQLTERVFLSMEFLAGEDLATRLRRDGALPLDEALCFARHIAGALDAAHALGIVHRDMKPANIMLVPATGDGSGKLRAVVTDFGLARLAPLLLGAKTSEDGYQDFVRTGRPVGTLGYMAPEQLAGEAVSPATDLYAFGLILFEMATGKSIFRSSDLLTSIAQRLKKPPSLEVLAPDFAQEWRSAIAACLHVKPAERLQSAAEVLAVLEGRRRALPSPVTTKTEWRRLLLPKLRFVAASVVIVALFVVGLRLWQIEADAKVAPGALVYLTEVRNQTGERSLDALTELLRAGLTQSAQVNLLDQGRAGDILQQMKKNPGTAIDGPVGREIAMRAGAARVVFVTVSGAKGSYRLDVDLQQPDNTPSRLRRHWPRSFAWKAAAVPTNGSDAIPAELLSSVRDASDWIRHEMGESANDIASLNTPPEDVTTGSWQALEEFANAERLHVQGKKDEAIWAYRNAVQLDPGFSMAYARLGDELVSLSRPLEAYQAYLTALSTDAGQRLSRKERDFIQGSYASDTRDYATALAAFRDYSNFYPNDYTAWYYQAFPLDMLDRPQEAIRVLLRADELSPKKHPEAAELSYNYLLIGDYPNLNRWIQTIHEAGRPDQATLVRALDNFVEGRYDESAQAFRLLENASTESYRRFGFAGLARVQAEREDDEAALKTLADEGNTLDPLQSQTERASLSIDRAAIHCTLKALEQCFQDIDQALRSDSSPENLLLASSAIGEAAPSMPKAMAALALRRLYDMQAMLPKEEIGTIYNLARYRISGEIHLAEGDPRQAVFEFRKADALDAPLRARDYLARGLVALAAHEQDSAIAMQLREEAWRLYAKVAFRPVIAWRRPFDYPPGFVVSEMRNFVQLSRALHHTDAKEQSVEAAIAGLRSASVPPAHPSTNSASAAAKDVSPQPILK